VPRKRLIRAAVPLYAATAVVIAGCVLFQIGEPATTLTVVQLGQILAAVLGVLGCAVAAWSSRGRARLSWSLLAVACLAWTAGQVMRCYFQLVTHIPLPFPSPADAAYLLSFPLAAAGIFCWPGRRSALGRARVLVDALVLVIGLLLISWVAVLGAIWTQPGGDPFARAISLAYPVGDLVLGAVLLLTIGATSGRRRTPLALIALGLLAIIGADCAVAVLTQQGSYNSTGLVTLGWPVGFLLIGLSGFAAVASSEDATTGATEGSTLFGQAIPLVAVMAGAAAGFYQRVVDGRINHWTALIVMGLIVVNVVQQLLAICENDRLRRGLEHRVEQRTAELANSEQRFRSLVTNSSDGIVIMKTDGLVVYASPSLSTVSPTTPELLVGANVYELWGDDPEAVRFRNACDEAVRRGGKPVVIDYIASSRRLETTITARLDDPAVGGLVLNTRDVTQQWQLHSDLTHQAFHDALTGLPNRRLFQDRLGHALVRTRSPQQLVVMLLDLDGFKTINDSMGHSHGDELLALVAGRLRESLRTGDTMARLGGDEFAVLLENVPDPEAAVRAAERLSAALNEPFVVAGREVVVRASIGIAPVTATGSVEDLIRNADLAMYVAKADRNTPHAIYLPAMHESATKRLELLADLRHAVARHELVLAYQPVVEIATGRLRSVEALVRWRHPQRGLVPPMDFVPLAEESGLILEIGTWVLRTACEQAADWRRMLAPGARFGVAVNISGQQLKAPGFVQTVRETMSNAGVRPEDLVLEMTESTLMEESEASLYTLRGLRSLGVKLAIDDFGTGYSSLSYLRQFPVDILKIDKAFVEGIDRGPEESAVARAVLRLGQTMHLTTVAEGIETESQRRTLVELSCPLGQGYLFSRPVSRDAITDLLLSSAAVSASVA
jgi:diguanylate cyclase (GGDEF)-like protein/PAS domain S-box-containing protein